MAPEPLKSGDSASGSSAGGGFKHKKLLLFVLIVSILLLSAGLAGIRYFSEYGIKAYEVPSGSMIPTIQIEDRVIANRVIYFFHPIERGDIVVFQPPAEIDSSSPYIKRVIALAGDTVEIKNRMVVVNGRPVTVNGAEDPTYTLPAETVPPGNIFVLGDNRDHSSDSHIWERCRQIM